MVCLNLALCRKVKDILDLCAGDGAAADNAADDSATDDSAADDDAADDDGADDDDADDDGAAGDGAEAHNAAAHNAAAHNAADNGAADNDAAGRLGDDEQLKALRKSRSKRALTAECKYLMKRPQCTFKGFRRVENAAALWDSYLSLAATCANSTARDRQTIRDLLTAVGAPAPASLRGQNLLHVAQQDSEALCETIGRGCLAAIVMNGNGGRKVHTKSAFLLVPTPT